MNRKFEMETINNTNHISNLNKNTDEDENINMKIKENIIINQKIKVSTENLPNEFFINEFIKKCPKVKLRTLFEANKYYENNKENCSDFSIFVLNPALNKQNILK